MRWSEEVLLVEEEMRRVLEYMSWFANWWTSHAAVPSMAHDFDSLCGKAGRSKIVPAQSLQDALEGCPIGLR
jgi:hypothetical protein